MDNLTHSLVGALLGQMGLKRRTGLAMPTLILAANLPDIEAGCALYGIETLAMRRGLTHGPMARLGMPLLLGAAILAFEIGRAAVCTPGTNAHLVCRILLGKKKTRQQVGHN